MTDRVMQISFLPQDIELIRKFLYDKTYSDSVSYNESLDAIYVNLSKVEKHEIVLSRITELIVSIIKDRDLKEYIWTTYTNISEEDKNKLSVRYEVNKTMAAKEFYDKVIDKEIILSEKTINNFRRLFVNLSIIE